MTNYFVFCVKTGAAEQQKHFQKQLEKTYALNQPTRVIAVTQGFYLSLHMVYGLLSHSTVKLTLQLVTPWSYC